jgi:ABC-type sugar transport system, ATPase component
MSNNDVLLSMNNINKSFSKVPVLTDVNFDLKYGEVHALVGENGAGKSTLVKIISGVYALDSGTIEFEDKKYVFSSPIQVQNLGINIIHQELFLADQMTVGENIFIGREPKNKIGMLDKKRLYSDSRKILERIGLDIDPKTRMDRLSVAQKQMVKIGEALSRESKILIMDEPTASLPKNETEKLFDLIKQLIGNGISIIYISHHLDEIFRIANRCTVLRDGKNVFTKNIQDIDIDTVIKAMVGKDVNTFFRQRKEQEQSQSREVLRIEHLSTKDKLTDINFSVKAGEVVGISGLLGSGRTELAMALFAQEKYDGKVYLEDKLIRKKDTGRAIKSGICYLPEERKQQAIFSDLSVTHNMTVSYIDDFIKRNFIRKRQEKNIVNEYIKKLSIKTASINQSIKYLSGGNQQKVIIARWILKKPKVLILDEPTRGIDIGAKVDIHELISQLASEGMAIILITSDMPEILALSDRIIVLKDGKIRGELEKHEFSQEKLLSIATK